MLWICHGFARLTKYTAIDVILIIHTLISKETTNKIDHNFVNKNLYYVLEWKSKKL